MGLNEQLIIKTTKSVVEAGPYPYKATWEDYQRAVEDWTWKIRQALDPDSPCPKCEDRDECISIQNPYSVTICTGFNLRGE